MITDEMMKLVDEFENSICTNWELGSIDAGFLNRELKELRAAIEAAQAWRPIETAPKDGTLVIVGAPGYASVSARWGWESPWIDGWWCDGHRSDAVGPEFTPTHWMPLPPPPGHQDTTKEGPDA